MAIAWPLCGRTESFSRLAGGARANPLPAFHHPGSQQTNPRFH
jgi:hypothetical protein